RFLKINLVNEAVRDRTAEDRGVQHVLALQVAGVLSLPLKQPLVLEALDRLADGAADGLDVGEVGHTRWPSVSGISRSVLGAKSSSMRSSRSVRPCSCVYCSSAPSDSR